MGTLRKIELPRYGIDGRRLRGTQEIVQIVKTPRPFTKQRLIEAIITLAPATFTKPATVKREVFQGDFMSVIGKVQAKYPGKKASYKTIDTRPDWLKKEQEEERDRKKKAESAGAVKE